MSRVLDFDAYLSSRATATPRRVIFINFLQEGERKIELRFTSFVMQRSNYSTRRIRMDEWSRNSGLEEPTEKKILQCIIECFFKTLIISKLLFFREIQPCMTLFHIPSCRTCTACVLW